MLDILAGVLEDDVLGADIAVARCRAEDGLARLFPAAVRVVVVVDVGGAHCDDECPCTARCPMEVDVTLLSSYGGFYYPISSLSCYLRVMADSGNSCCVLVVCW